MTPFVWIVRPHHPYPKPRGVIPTPLYDSAPMTDVAIVGAGYVGVPLAQVFAEAGRSVLLVEGLHALAPDIVDPAVGAEVPFRLFVHPATALPFDRLSSVLPEDVRLLRRIVRDRHQRGYLAHESIRRWPSAMTRQ